MIVEFVFIAIGLGIFSWIAFSLISNNTKETPEQFEQRMRDNLRELWKNNNVPLLKFKSHEEGERFLKIVAEGGGVHSLPPPYREQVDNYIKTRPLSIAQARAELKKERERFYMDHYRARLGSPSRSIRDWEEWEKREELAITNPAQHARLVKLGIHEPWFRMPDDEDFMYCVLDIIVQDEFPDTAKLCKYIGSLSDDGLEKLMNIIGNKLERLK